MREICTSGSDRGAARRLPSLPDLKRRRTIDCVVIGIAGDHTRPWLVLGLRHADGQLHHLGLARPSKGMVSPQFASVLAQVGPEESPIRSRWQHAAVPTWRRVPPTAVCEVAYTVLETARWLCIAPFGKPVVPDV